MMAVSYKNGTLIEAEAMGGGGGGKKLLSLYAAFETAARYKERVSHPESCRFSCLQHWQYLVTFNSLLGGFCVKSVCVCSGWGGLTKCSSTSTKTKSKAVRASTSCACVCVLRVFGQPHSRVARLVDHTTGLASLRALLGQRLRVRNAISVRGMAGVYTAFKRRVSSGINIDDAEIL